MRKLKTLTYADGTTAVCDEGINITLNNMEPTVSYMEVHDSIAKAFFDAPDNYQVDHVNKHIKWEKTKANKGEGNSVPTTLQVDNPVNNSTPANNGMPTVPFTPPGQIKHNTSQG